MARQVDALPKGVRTGGKYAWHDWLNGEVWEFTLGEDFEDDAARRRLRSAAQSAAQTRHGRIISQNHGDKLYLQFVTDER